MCQELRYITVGCGVITPLRERHANFFFFFFNDTATTEIYTLSLHDALPISQHPGRSRRTDLSPALHARRRLLHHGIARRQPDRKSTRLNSSHLVISYAVFCLKKKKNKKIKNS